MGKLIASIFSRLMKNVLFWSILILLFLFGMYSSSSEGSALSGTSSTYSLDGCLFEFAPLMGMISAIFISLFIGSEYSDGVIRNKLITGHSRSSVYLSNMIVCSIANILLSFAYISAVLIIGHTQNGGELSQKGTVIFFLLCSVAMSIAFASLMTLLAMLNCNKAGNVVVSMLLALALLLVSSFIYESLAEPEQYDRYISVNEMGIPTEVERSPNPNYINGTQRKVLEIINDCLPSGQAMQIANSFDSGGIAVKDDFTYPYIWLVYSFVFVATTSGIGILFFKIKEIK